jgi:hypothetical protein
LDKNALDIKVWVDPYAKFDELSVNALDGNNLTNAFDLQLMTAFSVGFNPSTKVYIFDKNTYWQVTRNTSENATILINKDRGYNMSIIQDGSTAQIQNQDSTTNTIIIKQTK